MSATFQTIPTANPAESAFVLTVDDNLITPDTLPAVGTTYAQWTLGQRERTKDTEWDNYVFVDTKDAAPGRRAFIFGKSGSVAEMLVPFETIYDSEFHRWPAVVVQQLTVLMVATYSTGGYPQNRWFVKSAAEGNCMIKVEHFQNAIAWSQSDLRHPMPITDDLNLQGTIIKDCLHGEIRLYGEPSDSTDVEIVPGSVGGIGHTIPATNYTDWATFILRDSQKQSNGLWVREKVTIYPPINAKRKMI